MCVLRARVGAAGKQRERRGESSQVAPIMRQSNGKYEHRRFTDEETGSEIANYLPSFGSIYGRVRTWCGYSVKYNWNKIFGLKIKERKLKFYIKACP